MTAIDLLNCIAHGMTHEEFLASFNGDVEAAAQHLQKFYLEQLAEQAAPAPGAEEMREAVRNTKRVLSALN